MLKLTLNKKAKVNVQGQVILENAIVFVTLAIIAISAMYLFAKLNNNIINRIGEFRNSRKQALNSPLNSIPDAEQPLAFLNLERGDMGSICPEIGSELDNFDFLCATDPRLIKAQLLELKAILIFNKVLPYNIYPMCGLVKIEVKKKKFLGIKYNVKVNMKIAANNYGKVKAFAAEAKSLILQSFDLNKQAIDNMQKAIDEPFVPGVYDPNPQEHPDLYKLDPTQAKEIKSLQEQNEHNRQDIKDNIEAKKEENSYFAATANENIIVPLDFIYKTINTGKLKGINVKKGIRAKVFIENAVETYEGIESYLSPVLRNDLVYLYGLLKDSFVKDDLAKARDLISQMYNSYSFLGESRPAGGKDAQAIDNYLSENQQAHDLIVNNPNPTEEQQKEIQDILSNGTKNTFQSVDNDNIIKELIDTLDEKLEKAIEAWESWEEIPLDNDENIRKKEIYKQGKDFAVDICGLYAEIIYKITLPSAIFDRYK